MSERKNIVTMKGNPLTLIGNEVKTGDKAPDFEVIQNDMSAYQYYKDKDPKKVYVISAVPSIDTGVCDKETRRFNEEAAKLSDDIEIITISVDLPFAFKRWCAAKGIDKVKTMSDHKNTSFGIAYGVLIKELRILARCVFVIDKEGIIRHIEMVNEIGNEPDYDRVINVAKKYV